MRFKNKVVLVTGAARGIGKSIASGFAKEGASLILNDILADELMETSEEISGSGADVFPVVTDVSNAELVAHMVSSGIARFGAIDVLVNNAGVHESGPAETFLESSWDKVLGVDLKGVFLCSQAVAGEMIKRQQGCIINLSSIAGYNALPGRAAYCSAKTAVIMLTKVLAIEWAKYNIRVNALAPGYVRTTMIGDMMQAGILHEDKILSRTPLNRIAEPDEIGRMAMVMAGDESRYMTGATVLMDGGWVAWGYY